MSMSTRPVILAAVCLLTACSAAAVPTPTTTPPTERPRESATAPPQPTATAEPTPTATTAAPVLAVGGSAEVVTTDLVVRSAPGTDTNSEILGTIANIGVYVLDGPVQADGFEWWQVVPDNYGQLGADLEGGWVARGTEDEVWLAPADRNCRAEPRSEELWAMPRTEWVGCYAGVQVTLRGVMTGCFQDGLGDWCVISFCPDDVPNDCAGLVDGESFVAIVDSPPDREEGRVAVTGHFGDFDLAAERCSAHPDLNQLAVFRCATFMVAATYRFTD